MKGSSADGPVKARAAAYFFDIDRALRGRGGSLDEIVRALAGKREIEEEDLRAALGAAGVEG